MLIRNITSKQDLENKKKLQAYYLKMSIDNVALQQQRVQDFQNPNKPPPIPPQYKTSSEIEQDVMEQQKMAIDNLKTLDVSLQVAGTVTQALLQQPEGIGNLVKLNKYFPAIKEDRFKKLSTQALNSSIVILEVLDKAFEDIDNNMGFFPSGKDSSSSYEAGVVRHMLAGKTAYISIKNRLNDLVGNYNIVANTYDALISKLDEIAVVSPTNNQITGIDTIGDKLVRNNIIKNIKSIENSLPNANTIVDAFNELGDIRDKIRGSNIDPANFKDDFVAIIAKLSRTFSRFDTKSQAKLQSITNRIAAEEGGVAASAVTVGGPTRASIIAQNLKEIDIRIKTFNIANTKERLLKDDAGFFTGNERYFDQVPTVDGLPPSADGKNVIFEGCNKLSQLGLNQRTGLPKELPIPKPARQKYHDFGNNPVDKEGYPIDLAKLPPNYLEHFLLKAIADKAVIKVITDATGQPVVTPDGRYSNRFINLNGVNIPEYDISDSYKQVVRYNDKQLKDIIIRDELPQIKAKLENDNTYDPLHKTDQRVITTQGFGFNAKRIKVGKGIGKEVEQPRYREFGKYIIHMPHLIDENVLNLKFPSAGSIPSIKPVKIDDNYKQFIMDVLDTNKVNKRHHETLTSEEKNHFAKIARGAKITNTLNFNPEEEDGEDYKRFELLIGEINAGNDNPKMIVEVKRLLKKYVENGKISKLKATDILLEL